MADQAQVQLPSVDAVCMCQMFCTNCHCIASHRMCSMQQSHQTCSEMQIVDVHLQCLFSLVRTGSIACVTKHPLHLIKHSKQFQLIQHACSIMQISQLRHSVS